MVAIPSIALADASGYISLNPSEIAPTVQPELPVAGAEGAQGVVPLRAYAPPLISYQIHYTRGKEEYISYSQTYGLDPTVFGADKKFDPTKCTFKNKFYNMTQTSVVEASDPYSGYRMSLSGLKMLDGGVKTMVVFSVSTSDGGASVDFGSDCHINEGESSISTLTKVVDFTWDKPTVIRLKNGATLEIEASRLDPSPSTSLRKSQSQGG
jgi:hypothetical protein